MKKVAAVCFVLAFICGLALIVLLAGCASAPTPFVTGKEVAPPYGCIELRARGGEC